MPQTALGSTKPGIVFIQTAAKSMILAAKSICSKAVCMKMTAESILPAVKRIKTAVKTILLKAKTTKIIVILVVFA